MKLIANRPLTSWLLILALFVSIVSVSGPFPGTAEAATTTLSPVADAYVYAGLPSNNFGGDTILRAKNDPSTGDESYLKFNTSGISGTVTSAKLRIYGSSSPAIDVAAFGVNTDSWTESGITWNNRPSSSTSALDTKNISGAQYYEWDVTSYVVSQSDGTVTLQLKAVQQFLRANFNSKENAASKPELVIVTGSTPTPPPGTSTTLNPAADAYVYAGLPSNNFGGDTILRAKNDPSTGDESYLKFNTSGISGTVTSAKLRVYGSSSPAIDVAAFGVNTDSWTESGITWNNRPSSSTSALDTNNISGAQYYEWDVTSYVAGQSDGTVTLQLKAVQQFLRANFNSKENAASKPQLVVTTGSGSTPTPTPTPTPTASPTSSPSPTPTPPPSGGFTTLTPSTDSKLIYVSNSTGSDSNTGLTSGSPVKTISKALTLVRNGYPDWILLKRGDTWRDQTVGSFINGRSASEPAVVTYYGTSGARPRIQISSNFVDTNGNVRNYQAYVGLDIINYRLDQSDSGFNGTTQASMRFVGGGNYLLIEDCRLQYVEIIVQGYGGNNHSNVNLKRNIVLDTYWRGSTTVDSHRPSGLYADNVNGLNIIENVFDHNGWHPTLSDAKANMFNHNIYLQVDNVGNGVVVKGNIIARGSSHGVHGRPGGLYENNLFVENSIGLQMGYAGYPLASGTFATAKDNVILAGKRMICCSSSSWPQTDAVWGLNLDALGSGTVTLNNNIVANRKESGSNMGIASYSGVTYTGNVQYNWGGGVGDTSNPGWLDPARSVGSYNASLGGSNSLTAFLNVVRDRGVGTWDTNYSANAVNTYIRAGFNK